MLSKPEVGWCKVTIDDFSADASYLVDLPFDWLRASFNSLRYNLPLALYIDEEGSNCTIVGEWCCSYVIINHGDYNPELKALNVDMLDIILALVRDINAYFEDWVTDFDEKETEDRTERRAELRELVDSVEKLLDEKLAQHHGICKPQREI